MRHSTPSTGKLISTLALVYAPTALIYVSLDEIYPLNLSSFKLFFASTPLLDEVTLKQVVFNAYPTYDFSTSASSELMIGKSIT